MSKYDSRLKAIEKKLPDDGLDGYFFFETAPGIYEDECENTYTQAEMDKLTCLPILFTDWYKHVPEKPEPAQAVEMAARQLKEHRRLQYMYGPDRQKYGLKPPFASAKPEDIPDGCTPGWNDNPLQPTNTDE